MEWHKKKRCAKIFILEIFEIRLNQQTVDENAIPYHILFLLEYEGKYKAAIGYKEAAEREEKQQLNKQVQMNAELNRLKKELEEL